jgi:lipoyl(octanoyl) transferase
MRIIDCGVMEYRQSLALQEQLVAAIGAGNGEETLLLLQHPPVYTIGRGGNPANILDPAVRVERVNRGGDVTWHGPGQVVGYPLVNLGRRGRDLHRWLRFLEEVLVHTLTVFGIKGYRRPGSTGVWTAQGKIAFIGVGVRRWVTMHGFSLNVIPDLAVFSRINPCGIRSCPVTSMAMEGTPHLSEQQVMLQLKNDFVHLLNRWLPLP